MQTTTILTALLRTSDAREFDGSAGALLRELLLSVLDECEFEDGSDNVDVLAAKGDNWSREFGLRVIETDSGDGDPEVTVEWGRGDEYTWCRLEDVIDGCMCGESYVPDWWQSEWTERRAIEA